SAQGPQGYRAQPVNAVAPGTPPQQTQPTNTGVESQQFRSPNWSPAPASQTSAQQSTQKSSGVSQPSAGNAPATNPGSPVASNGMISAPTQVPQGQAIPVARSNEAQYGVPQDEAARSQFYSKLSQDQPVAGSPGMSWHHNGQGWTIVPSGSSGEQPAGQ